MTTTTADEPVTMQSLFRSAAHRQNLCVLALLTWVASCDGSIADAELDLLRSVAAGVSGVSLTSAPIEARASRTGCASARSA